MWPLSSVAPGGTLWAQKALLTRSKGYTAHVRVALVHRQEHKS